MQRGKKLKGNPAGDSPFICAHNRVALLESEMPPSRRACACTLYIVLICLPMGVTGGGGGADIWAPLLPWVPHDFSCTIMAHPNLYHPRVVHSRFPELMFRVSRSHFAGTMSLISCGMRMGLFGATRCNFSFHTPRGLGIFIFILCLVTKKLPIKTLVRSRLARAMHSMSFVGAVIEDQGGRHAHAAGSAVPEKHLGS